MKKKILITGCTGFIGTNLINKLYKKYDLYGVSRVQRNNSKITIIKTDITKTDFEFIDDLKLNYVVHLAAFSSPSRSNMADKQEVIDLNYNATKKLFEKLKTKNLEKIVFMSSAVVYKPKGICNEQSELVSPNDGIYIKTKLNCEELCEDYIKQGMPIVTFRLSNCYGPQQQWKKEDIPTIIPQFIMQSFDKNIHVLNRNISRDFIYIGDCIDAISKALESKYNGILNLGSGQAVSTEEIARIISWINKSKLTFFNEETKDKNVSYLDISKIKKELFWEPKYTITQGIKETIKFYKKLK